MAAVLELQRQRGNLETSIKSLVNLDLKEICKAYDYQVSGNKAVLQTRCIEILDTVINSGDLEKFRVLQYRVANKGRAPPRSHGSSAPFASSSASNYQHPDDVNSHASYNQSMAPRASSQSSRVPSIGRIYFKNSPFYDVLETVLPLQDLPEMPQNRHTVRVTLTLTHDQTNRLRSEPNLRLMLYCGAAASININASTDVAFPNQLEVKINGDDVKANFKGLKNKPGSTKPADLTDKVRKNPGYQNQLHITYALTQKRFAFLVLLVRYNNADYLTQLIETVKHGGGIIPKEKVIQEMRRSNADDDIAATSVRMSLKDPISTLRITLPVRSTVCSHNQCFDASMFLQLQDQAPQWSCPVCAKSVSYQSLCIDKYFEDILQKTPHSIEKVDIEPDGNWKVIKEEDEQKPSGHSGKDGRAAYDDDFDDDLFEVTEPQSRPTNGVATSSRAPSMAVQSMSGSGFAMNTPPLSSRGASAAPSASSAQPSNKRAASSVIDLTLSDEEDEPPRPAKRQSTASTQHGNHSSTYNTPTSLSDHRYSSYPAGSARLTDSYRPSSNASRPAVNGGSSTTVNGYGLPNSHLASSNTAGSPYSTGNFSNSYSNSSGNQQQQSWAPHHSRPSSKTEPSHPTPFQSFALRPPPPSMSPAGQHDSLRLPPMRPPPDPHGWRSDNSYSHSPPGG